MTAGGQVLQSGTVTAGHYVTWATDGVLQDGGSTTPVGYENVLLFGADPSGAAYSDAAFAAAFAAGNSVFVPPGTYKFAAQLTKTLGAGQSFSLLGSGQGTANLYWPNSGGGVAVTYAVNNWYFQPNALTVSGLSFLTAVDNPGSALSINGAFVTGRITAPTTIRDCTFAGTNLNISQWAVGIALGAVAQTVVDGCSFFGKYAAYTATGVQYTGTAQGIATGHQVLNCTSFYTKYAVWANTYTQGVQVVQCNFTMVQYGVYGNGVIGSFSAGFSSLQQLSVTASQIEATTACVYITGGVDCQITGNLFLLAGVARSNTSNIVLDSCIRCLVTGNDCVGIATNNGQSGVLFSNAQTAAQTSYPNAVADNVFNALQYGVQIVAGSIGTSIGYSTYSASGSVATRILDNGTGTVSLDTYNASNMTSISTGSTAARSFSARGADWFNVKDYGAAGDGVYISAAITVQAGTPTQLVVSGAAFKTTDVGKFLSVTGIGSAGAALATTIASYVNATTIIMANAASTFVTSSTQTVVYGTDDSAAIQAAFTAAGAGVAGNSTKAASRIGNNYPTTVLFPDAIYIVRTTLDATSYIGGTIRGFGGAWLYGAITPQVNSNAAVIDAIGGYNTKIDGISIYGDAGLTPTTGIQWGRYRAVGVGVPATGRCAMSNVTTSGYFSIAAVYAMMCETTVYTNLNLNNAANAAGGYSAANPAAAMIDDGSNRFGLTSYLTFTLSANVAVTNTVVTYIGCRFVASGTGSPGLWMSNANGRRLIGCYWSSPGDATVVIYMTSGIRSKDLVFWGNMEGNDTTLQADNFYFDGSGSTLITGLDVRTSANNPGANFFNNNASITTIKVDDFKVSADAVPAGTAVFANPGVWNIGNADFSFSTDTGGWVPPAQFYGTLNIAQNTTWFNNGQPAPMTANYSAALGGTGGAVTTLGFVSTATYRIDAGGAIASVAPIINITPPPSGGTQAVVTVASMGLTSTGYGTILGPGTGYSVNDILTLSGCTGTAPQIKVLTAPGGVPATFSQQTVGAATVLPSSTAGSPAVWTGGTGSGFTTTGLGWKIPGLSNLTLTNAGAGYQTIGYYFTVPAGTVVSSNASAISLALGSTFTASGGGIQQIATSATQLSLGAAGTTNPVPVMTLGAQHDTAIAFIVSTSVSNGATQTAAANTDGMYLKNAANVATQTILLPPFTGVAGQTFWVASLGGIGTTATFQTSTGGAITGAPTTIAAGGVHRFVADTNTWYPQG